LEEVDNLTREQQIKIARKAGFGGPAHRADQLKPQETAQVAEALKTLANQLRGSAYRRKRLQGRAEETYPEPTQT
jgi:hypothetical protein